MGQAAWKIRDPKGKLGEGVGAPKYLPQQASLELGFRGEAPPWPRCLNAIPFILFIQHRRAGPRERWEADLRQARSCPLGVIFIK